MRDRVEQRRNRLRAQVWELDRGTCAWPWPGRPGGRCGMPATELAHLHSVGMGGRASADTLQNAMAACTVHARCSDLEPPPGGSRRDLWAELLRVPGLPDFDVEHINRSVLGRAALGWWLAEALQAAVQAQRKAAGWDL